MSPTVSDSWLTEGEHSPLEDSPLWEWCGYWLGSLDAGAIPLVLKRF